MPTYQYRCLRCASVQSVVQGMLEQFAPACAGCGGFTEKFITQAPTVVSRRPEAPESVPEPETHHCVSGCVLHQPHQIAVPNKPGQASSRRDGPP